MERTPFSPSQEEVHLSHSSFRKRVRQEYQKLCQVKKARLVASVKTELQENRKIVAEFLQNDVSG